MIAPLTINNTNGLFYNLIHSVCVMHFPGYKAGTRGHTQARLVCDIPSKDKKTIMQEIPNPKISGS